MPAPADVLLIGIGTAASAAVTAGVNAFIQGRGKVKTQRTALAELVIACELLMTDLEPDQQKVMQAKVTAARAVLGD